MTTVGIPKETRSGETRVAATPDSVRKLGKKSLKIRVERGAGLAAAYRDEDYTAAGAELVDAASAFGAEIVLKVLKPTSEEILKLKKGAVLISFLEPYTKDGTFEKLAEARASTRSRWS